MMAAMLFENVIQNVWKKDQKPILLKTKSQKDKEKKRRKVKKRRKILKSQKDEENKRLKVKETTNEEEKNN